MFLFFPFPGVPILRIEVTMRDFKEECLLFTEKYDFEIFLHIFLLLQFNLEP